MTSSTKPKFLSNRKTLQFADFDCLPLLDSFIGDSIISARVGSKDAIRTQMISFLFIEPAIRGRTLCPPGCR